MNISFQKKTFIYARKYICDKNGTFSYHFDECKTKITTCIF